MYDLGEVIFGHKTGLMHFFANLSFFCLNLNGILKGQYTPGIIIFPFDGHTVYKERKTVVILQISKYFPAVGDNGLHGNIRKIFADGMADQ